MTKRTVKNCRLIKKMVAEGVGTPKIFPDGSCDGYADWNEDEPCEKCKSCKLNVWYEED